VRHPSLLLVGHGSRSAAGVAEYWRFAAVLRAEAPALDVGCGFIELAPPRLDAAIDALVAGGAASVAAVPLVLLGAGHMKNDGPAALASARRRHPGVAFHYGRDLGVHPGVLGVAQERIGEAGAGGRPETAVVVVGRGSSDPDANADLYKVARLLSDGRGGALVEPAFVSLATPSVPHTLERCRRLGARRIAVVPYFLFTGVLVDRIGDQAARWAQGQPGIEVVVGRHLGPDRRIAGLVLERYREAVEGEVRMNCDACVYRVALPGHEHRVGRPVPVHPHHDHTDAMGERR
jgi:sirohydrochlorin ferrochelatase